jgi:hypothetical protein
MLPLRDFLLHLLVLAALPRHALILSHGPEYLALPGLSEAGALRFHHLLRVRHLRVIHLRLLAL